MGIFRPILGCEVYLVSVLRRLRVNASRDTRGLSFPRVDTSKNTSILTLHIVYRIFTTTVQQPCTLSQRRKHQRYAIYWPDSSLPRQITTAWLIPRCRSQHVTRRRLALPAVGGRWADPYRAATYHAGPARASVVFTPHGTGAEHANEIDSPAKDGTPAM